MGKCIMCPHCESWFFPEKGVTLDDCPKCGRTVEVKPAPAPLPGDDGVMCARLLFACTGHPHALIPWPHRLLHDAVAHISDLTRRLAGAEEEKAVLSEAHNGQVRVAIAMQDRAEAAEARVRELEALRERCEKLEAALGEIGGSEERICNYCEGEGNRYADGKAHYYSEHAPTILCPECGGRGRIRDMDSEDMAAIALAALAATEAE